MSKRQKSTFDFHPIWIYLQIGVFILQAFIIYVPDTVLGAMDIHAKMKFSGEGRRATQDLQCSVISAIST